MATIVEIETPRTTPRTRTLGVVTALTGCLLECPSSLLIRLAKFEQGLGCATGYKYATKSLILSIGLTCWLGGPRAVIRDCFKIGWHFFLAAAICEAAMCVLWNLAVMLTSAANASAFAMLNPMWCIMFTFLLTWERIPMYTLAASIVTFACGVAIFVTSQKSQRRGVESLLGDVLGILCGMSLGVFLTVMRHVQKKHPGANPAGVVALGGLLAAAASFMLVEAEGNLHEACYPKSGAIGYTWSLTDGMVTTMSHILVGLSTRQLPSAVTGLLFLMTAIIQPYLVWLVLEERPLDTTLFWGAILCVTLVVHEIVSFYYAHLKLRGS
mmetsp:Transcript_2/g.5  ORF Transcript_2/g.5 Transcript_2/m.5 type:complete len:326 (+) Transcript_2:88-1065(+)